MDPQPAKNFWALDDNQEGPFILMVNPPPLLSSQPILVQSAHVACREHAAIGNNMYISPLRWLRNFIIEPQ